MTRATPVPDRLYTPLFFRVFAAAVLFMTGVALQFHFGQYIAYLGHGVDTLGRLLSLATLGTLLARLQLGRCIDRFGCRPTWIGGALVVAVAAGSMQFFESLWIIAILRMVTVMAAAAVMTTVAVLAAWMAPPRRRAESIGTMGLAGFTGMVLGASLGDVIFSGSSESFVPYRVFFSTSTACSLLSVVAIARLRLPRSPGLAAPIAPVGGAPGWPTASAVGDSNLPPRSGRGAGVAHRFSGLGLESTAAGGGAAVGPSVWSVLLTYWPGTILLVGVVFNMVSSLHMSFLERLAEARGFMHIKVFFLCYSSTAIVLRLVFRRLPEQLGRTRTLLLGMTLLSIGTLLLVGVTTQAGLIPPGLLMGAGHSFIFPSMVDLAADRLPPEHRGVGTSLILGAGDLGLLIGFAVVGQLIDACGFDTSLVALGCMVFVGAIVFGLSRRDAVLSRTREP